MNFNNIKNDIFEDLEKIREDINNQNKLIDEKIKKKNTKSTKIADKLADEVLKLNE